MLWAPPFLINTKMIYSKINQMYYLREDRSLKQFPIVLLTVLILCSFLIGCGDKIKDSPVLPSPQSSKPEFINEPGSNHDFSATGFHKILGAYDISLDSDNNFNITPVRLAAEHLNVLVFFEVNPCADCLVISNIQPVGPYEWNIDIQLRHPFPGLDQYTAFDVRAIFMFDPTCTFPGSGLSMPDPDFTAGGALLNPDGYTGLFNPVDYPPGSAMWKLWEYQVGKYATPVCPVSTLNPYKNYSTETERRYLGCTAADTQTCHIRFPSDGPLHFGYVIDACWAPPVSNPPVVPDDFPLEANRPEPYNAVLEIIKNTLWADPDLGSGGILEFSIKVYDHQDSHPSSAGGTIEKFRWEIPGMTGWENLNAGSWADGIDQFGSFTRYYFYKAPVPVNFGPHKLLICIIGTETGIDGSPEKAYILSGINVAQGETCWSAGELISDEPNEDFQAHLNNAHASFVDDMGRLHVFFPDTGWYPHHLVYQDGVISDEIFIAGEMTYNLNAIPAENGGVHLMYSDNPSLKGGNVVYRYITPGWVVGPPTFLNASYGDRQYLSTIAEAPDGTMLALWMNSQDYPNRQVCGAYFNGSGWTPEMKLAYCYIPNGWTSQTVVADSLSVFHIIYGDGEPQDLKYFQFDHGIQSNIEAIVTGDWNSHAPISSIDSQDNIFLTFTDSRYGGNRGFLILRDSMTGGWSEPKDMLGTDHWCRRYQHTSMPDGRLAVVWIDNRCGVRGVYSKVFDPHLSEDEIQATPDDSVDTFINTEEKNQTRLCLDPWGTLHLVWADYRSGDHWQLFYSKCTP